MTEQAKSTYLHSLLFEKHLRNKRGFLSNTKQSRNLNMKEEKGTVKNIVIALVKKEKWSVMLLKGEYFYQSFNYKYSKKNNQNNEAIITNLFGQDQIN